jgi:oligoribonuclease (3'-5' exoribonuclease)
MKYFKSHSEFLNEAKLSAIHKAAKKGSYPVTVVVVSNGSVTKQEIVNTPAAVPAVFNELQKEYPGATINIESKTGETLFVESVLNEKLARGLKPLLKLGTTITKKAGEDALLDLSDKFDRIDDEYAGTIASHLDMAIELMQDGYAGDATKKLKQFNKACKDVLNGKDVGSAFESTITEGKFNKRSLMKAMKKDDGMIQLGNGQEYVIYNPNNGNDDNADMWQDKVIFGLDQDGEEHEIEYSDIVRYDESRKINLKQDHLSSEEYQKAKTLKDFNKEDWKWNSKSGLYDKVNESVITENRDAKTIVKAFMKAYNKGEEVDAEAWEQFMYDWAVMRNGNDELEDEVSYDTMDDVLDMLLKKGYKKIDDEAIIKLYEATDLNDPVLVAYRATRKTLPKFKPAKAKSRRLSFDKYMDLLDARLDVDQQIKDLRDEMSQTLRDMEQEAEPEGGEIADEYGSTMMDQEKEYAKLMAKKDKIMARIDKHRMA